MQYKGNREKKMVDEKTVYRWHSAEPVLPTTGYNKELALVSPTVDSMAYENIMDRGPLENIGVTEISTRIWTRAAEEQEKREKEEDARRSVQEERRRRRRLPWSMLLRSYGPDLERVTEAAGDDPVVGIELRSYAVGERWLTCLRKGITVV
ncbi:hypothetical protein MMC18_008727 [Xylographa bjoerkii]|nr:hypothetical protein [Xylographa bjoerkii]